MCLGRCRLPHSTRGLWSLLSGYPGPAVAHGGKNAFQTDEFVGNLHCIKQVLITADLFTQCLDAGLQRL